MFNIGDPRMQAISQAGSGLGSGLSNALVRFVENRNLQKGLQGINAQTPIQDVLSQLAGANVSPELLNTYLSPTVQNRLGQERAGNVFKQLGNLSSEQLQNM